jgi:hypothetical protein
VTDIAVNQAGWACVILGQYRVGFLGAEPEAASKTNTVIL